MPLASAWMSGSAQEFESGGLFEWRLMLGQAYQLWSEIDSEAASQGGVLSAQVFALRMAYLYPQAKGESLPLAKGLLSKRWESQAQEKTSDLQRADRRSRRHLRSNPIQAKMPAIASLPPYGPDACDKKPPCAMIGWNESPLVRQAKPAMQK